MSERYVSIALDQLLVGEPLPGNLYVNIDGRFITFRAEGDVIDQPTYQRLELKNVSSLFVLDQDYPRFESWAAKMPPSGGGPPASQENREFIAAWKHAHRKTLDIFQSAHPDAHISGAISASKKLVAEVAKFPYAVQSLAQLQTFSRGLVDHSLNVSILSTYLAMQMGYTHQIILQHVSLGGLLHDIGKRKVDILDTDSPETTEAKLREHSTLGLRLIEANDDIPNEVKLIVAQHHELNDGTGYPKKLRGNNIYDLARIVCIANLYDRLVSESKGTLQERQKAALDIFDTKFLQKIDTDKHDKAVRILALGV